MPVYSNSQPSQIRRPWSPEPLETTQPVAPSSLNTNDEFDSYNERSWFALQRHETSDASVEALDLAEYSRTLRIRDAFLETSGYPQHSRPLLSSPSNDTLETPSFISRTRTSNTHSPSSRSHRPSSLTPPSRSIATDSCYRNNSIYGPDPQIRSQDSEIDISHFPAWSRNWYHTSDSTSVPTSPLDIYTPLPKSHLTTKVQRSPFDPGQIYPDLKDLSSDQCDFGPTSSLGHESTRDLLPWEFDHPDAAPIDSSLKGERMRMLEREFGPNAKGKGRIEESNDPQMLDDNGKPLIGTVDAKGYLVTQGPKKRTTVRILQILLSLTAAGPSIYAALFIKPTEAPPPAGKAPAFVIYILSVLTFLLLLYLFVFRPCCCMSKRSKSIDTPFSNGMMVLPVQGLPGGRKGKKKGRKQEQVVHGGDVQVNLIVNPEAFESREEEDSEEEDGGWNASMCEGDRSTGRRRNGRRARRRSVFAGLAMEENWKRARSWAKRVTLVDVVLLFVWGAAFVFIMIGQRCPSGGFDGWCNAYNMSSAAACLLSVTFGVSTFFNVKDLNDSKVSPRTRT